MKGAEYEYERLANPVFVLGIVKLVTPICSERNTAGFRDSVPKDRQ